MNYGYYFILCFAFWIDGKRNWSHHGSNGIIEHKLRQLHIWDYIYVWFWLYILPVPNPEAEAEPVIINKKDQS